MRKIERIIIHCTAASSSQKTNDIIKYWRKKGWASNGYHWLVSENGIAERLQGDEYVSNGVKGYNATAINICYKGGWNKKDTRTTEQKETLLFLIQEYKNKYPDAVVCGHRDLSPDLDGDGIIENQEWLKVCPCFSVADWLKDEVLIS